MDTLRTSTIAPFILLNERLDMPELSGSPLCVHGMKVLVAAGEQQGIPLTKSGAFYRKFVTWAADDFCWPEYEAEKLYVVNKVLNEPDFLPLAIMHDLLLAAKLLRHYRGEAVLTRQGKAILGDYGALQVALFDAAFSVVDYTDYERFPIEYEEADIAHFLGVVHNRLDEWVPLGELAGWCLPLELITKHRFSPTLDACFYLLSRLTRPLLWLGLIEQRHEHRQARIEDRQYRKTALCDRFLRFEPARETSFTIH